MSRSVWGGILFAIALFLLYRSVASETNGSPLDLPIGAVGDAIVGESSMTPLEKAGTLPKRQTESSPAAMPLPGDPDPDSPPRSAPLTTPAPDPIRALW